MQDPSDEQLVRAFQKGDEAAFSAFAARHADRLFRLATMWLKDPNLADDAVQETLLRTYSGLGRFRFRAKPTTWLVRTLKNVCREQNRQRQFVPIGAERLAGLVHEDDVDAEMRSKRNLAALREALSSLPERQREAVTLRMLEELSIRETARIMGCREGTVKAHLNRAVHALKDHMEECR